MERIEQLEKIRDWQSLLAELEAGVARASDPVTKGDLLTKLGRVLSERFLQSNRALRVFQEALKANPRDFSALRFARDIYADLGKSNMVQKLIELELKGRGDGSDSVSLLLELGEALLEQGEAERAAAAFARALSASDGARPFASPAQDSRTPRSPRENGRTWSMSSWRKAQLTR